MGLNLSLRVYLDTNVFIAALEGAGDSASLARDILKMLEKRPDLGVTSELTLAEILVPRNAVFKRLVFERIVWGGLVKLCPVTRDILIQSATLRQTIRHGLADAIHIATAVDARCDYILSYDQDMKRLPAPLICVKPDADGLSLLRNALA